MNHSTLTHILFISLFCYSHAQGAIASIGGYIIETSLCLRYPDLELLKITAVCRNQGRGQLALIKYRSNGVERFAGGFIRDDIMFTHFCFSHEDAEEYFNRLRPDCQITIRDRGEQELLLRDPRA